MSRPEHTFQFAAEQIALAAATEAAYHETRLAYWEDQYERSAKIVEATIGAKLARVPVTDGERVEVVIDYGDPAAYRRLQEAWGKMGQHRQAAGRFRTDERLYGTQGSRIYELTTEEVHHFRLGGTPREE